MDKRRGKSSKKERIKLRKKLLEDGSLVEPSKVEHVPSENNFVNENSTKAKIEKRKDKLSGKKRKDQRLDEVDQFVSHGEDASLETKGGKLIQGKEGKKKQKLSKKNREKQKVSKADVDEIYQHRAEDGEVGSKKLKDEPERAGKKRKKDQSSSEKVSKLIKEANGSAASEVYQISSVDLDSCKGMKKWINEYHQSRLGLKILQERIDEFITSHEEQEEQARREREALAAEGGWTVVGQQKGRKKTTEAESGTAVGSVAQAAVLDKMGKKKSKDVGVDFYRFQKREAQRNEIMMLQSKFEQDKKRIQQLRAARKFRPY